MSDLLVTFTLSIVAIGALVGLKNHEMARGRRVFLSGIRGALDMLTDTLPAATARTVRLFLARLSLQAHEVIRWTHDSVGLTRTFFRRFTIKLFASAHSHGGTSAPNTTTSPFWNKITSRKSNLSR